MYCEKVRESPYLHSFKPDVYITIKTIDSDPSSIQVRKTGSREVHFTFAYMYSFVSNVKL